MYVDMFALPLLKAREIDEIHLLEALQRDLVQERVSEAYCQLQLETSKRPVPEDPRTELLTTDDLKTRCRVPAAAFSKRSGCSHG